MKYGPNFDTMLLVPDLKKDQITGGAVEEYDNLVRSLEFDLKSKRFMDQFDLIETVSIKDLSQVLKWCYKTVSRKSFLPQFKGLVEEYPYRRCIKIENVPKFLEVLYKTMGEAA